MDGEILVDKASFGANGFYLPFDPSNTGANYSSGTTVAGDFVQPEQQYVENMFVGKPNTGSDLLQLPYIIASGGSGTITYTNLPNGTNWSINVGYGAGLSSTDGYKINDGALIPYTTFNNKTFTNLTSTQLNCQNTITKIEIIHGSSGAGGIDSPSGIMVDGVLLVDHSSIGVDASGKNNNFHDQNFGLDDSGFVYSAQAGVNANDGDAKDLYDGTFTTNVLYGGTTYRIFAGPSITANSSLAIAWSTGAAPNVSINGQSEISTPNGDGSAAYYTVPNFTGVINTIDVRFTSNANVYGIMVDGKVLTDPQYLDTVTDTPVMAYAVCTSNSTFTGSNGNLAITMVGSGGYSPSSLSLDPTKSYYFETTVSKDINSVGWHY